MVRIRGSTLPPYSVSLYLSCFLPVGKMLIRLRSIFFCVSLSRSGSNNNDNNRASAGFDHPREELHEVVRTVGDLVAIVGE